MTSVFFTNADTGFIVGDAGIILKTTDAGISWDSITSGTDKYLNCVYFSDANNGTIVGNNGTILKTTNGGTNWTPQTSEITLHLMGVFFTDANNGTIVGESGSIFRTTDNGTTWTLEETNTPNPLFGVFFTNTNNGTVVGQGGVILRTSGSPDFVIANLKVYLEGPYNENAMTTILNTYNLIPLTSDSAYSTAVYNYTASVVGSIPNSDIVDWVLVELRTGTTSDSIVGKRAAFIKSDGTIVDINGSSPVTFTGLSYSNYYVVIRHRNHLAIMSKNKIALSSSSALYDFTTSQSQAYTSGTDPMIALSGGGFGMIAADANTSAIITAADVTPIISNLNNSVYVGADVNMSAIVTAADVTKIISNLNKATNVP